MSRLSTNGRWGEVTHTLIGKNGIGELEAVILSSFTHFYLRDEIGVTIGFTQLRLLCLSTQGTRQRGHMSLIEANWFIYPLGSRTDAGCGMRPAKF